MRHFICCVAVGLSSAASAEHAVHVLGEPSAHLEMISWAEAPTDLIGGTVVKAEDYPGVFYTWQEFEGGTASCTGTLVGNQVVATAAHCVYNGGTLSLKYKEVEYSGICQRAPEYAQGNATADWALCLLSKPIPDAIAELINTDGARLTKGAKITLTGYGCTSGGGGGNDGSLRVGTAPIISLPNVQNRDYDIVTSGSAALCFGDSGGPSFVEVAGKRYQTGINSRGDIFTTSYLSALHVPKAQEFYQKFAEKNAVKICGMHADAQGCRP